MQQKVGNLKSYLCVGRPETSQRIGHRAIQVGHHILVFGGTNSTNEFVTNILKISTENIFIEIIITSTQLRLEEFSLFSYKEHIYLWGGNGAMGRENRLLKFTGETFQQVSQNGDVPSPRSHHTSFFFSRKYLIIQGGTNGNKYFNDFFLLDCSSFTWSRLILDCEVPLCLRSYIFWNGGRGFFMTGETFDPEYKRSNYEYLIYELRFTDLKNFRASLQPLVITEGARRPAELKRQPTVILFNFQSPYLMLIGGQIANENSQLAPSVSEAFNYSDLWIFNLETLQWTSSNLKLTSAGFGFEAIYYQERLYLIGGVKATLGGSKPNKYQLATAIEAVEIYADCLEAKLCGVCREMYGFKDYSNSGKQFVIKYEHEEAERTFFSVKTISKMAKFLRNPFSAIGLLVDNSINMNASNMTIEFKFFDLQKDQAIGSMIQSSFAETQSLLQKTSDNKLKMKYNYIKITDDTCAFTQNEIVECLCAFGIKTQKLTTDKKYEEQLEIRRQYGLNIKLGALRLATSCLYVARTQDQLTFVCYFSTIEKNVGEKFKIVSYFISQNNQRSSQISYSIIKESVGQYLPLDYETLVNGTKTNIYLFNIQSQQLIKEVIDFDSSDITYKTSSGRIFKSLRLYIESLYFTPPTCKNIKIQKSFLKFRQYPQIFKKDQQQKLLIRLNLGLKQANFKTYAIFKCINSKYPLKQILVYHENRLLYSIGTNSSNLCGYFVLPDSISIDLCKTKIQSQSDEYLFHRYVHSIIINHSKYLPDSSQPPNS